MDDNKIIKIAQRMIADENRQRNLIGDQMRLNYFAGQIDGLNNILISHRLSTTTKQVEDDNGHVYRFWKLLIHENNV